MFSWAAGAATVPITHTEFSWNAGSSLPRKLPRLDLDVGRGIASLFLPQNAAEQGTGAAPHPEEPARPGWDLVDVDANVLHEALAGQLDTHLKVHGSASDRDDTLFAVVTDVCLSQPETSRHALTKCALKIARLHGVRRMVVPGVNLAHSVDCQRLSSKHPGVCFATAGVHPYYAQGLWRAHAVRSRSDSHSLHRVSQRLIAPLATPTWRCSDN